VDGLSYLFTAALESRIRVSEEPKSKLVVSDEGRLGFYRASTEGWRYVRRNPDLKRLFIAAVPLNVLLSPVWVLLPFYTTTVIAKPENWYGYFLAAFCLGLLSGYLLPGLSRSVFRCGAEIMMLSIAAVPLLMLGLSVLRSAPYTLLALAMIGLSTGLISVFGVLMVQTLSGSEAQGRVMGLLIMITQGVAPLIGGLAGFITGRTALDIRSMYAVCACLMLVSSVTFLGRRDSRQVIAKIRVIVRNNE
jgi:MFS family permease